MRRTSAPSAGILINPRRTKAFRTAADEIFTEVYQFHRGKGKNNAAWTAESIRLSDEEATILQQFVAVCEPARFVLRLCEGSSYPTISRLLFCYYALLNHFESASTNAAYHQRVREFAKAALENVQIKFNPRGKDQAAVIAACLDPRYRQLHYLTPADRTFFHTTLYNVWHSLDEQRQVQTDDNEEGEPAWKRSRTLTLNEVGGFSVKKDRLTTEYQRWIESPDIDEEYDILIWSKENAKHFPVLAPLAQRYLAIPASSAASERVFSRLKDTLSVKRTRMSSETLCQLLFVRHHQNELIEMITS